ncbi:protein PHYTOCHROME KINASE SUBSTRATE 1-like [Lotus japonicus]|uniref:protein PHYTOCHROME KINASE SUBSTRATE 1-like n=1 Tax=Lotus japonicus TaxID=34305 RepID=UPI0025850209|nr:protein PHYTOCHROME KINASE SUBSTRATE 1-like [Lotus japonicus]
MVITATPSNSTLHHLKTFNSQNNNNLLRDASFSSYLNNKEETFADSSHPFTRKDPLHQGVKKEDDEEIGVFEAEKYFHGGEIGSPRVAIIGASKYQHQKKEETAQETRRYKVLYGTPSVRSESSLNSQSALLPSVVNNSSRNSKSKAQRKSFLAGLGCKCYCSDKNSVDISDHAADSNHSAKATKPHAEIFINKDVYFQKPEKLPFSTVNSSSGNQPLKVQIQVEKPRKSLEVFGSPILDNISKSVSFDRRLSMPSWESANSVGNFDDDAASDASSDLFEIDSFTGKSNPFLGKSTSNIASGCASPTTCYAPSEASIAWSVVTASAVDFDDQRSVATIRSPIRTSSLTSSNVKPKAGKEMQRRHSSNLLGCKSQKAVGVAVDAFTTCEKPGSTPQIRRKSEMFPHVTKLQGGAKEENFGAKHGQQHVYAKRTPSPRASSQLLYI